MTAVHTAPEAPPQPPAQPPIWFPVRGPRPPRPEVPSAAVVIVQVLMVLAVAAFWTLGYALGIGALQAERGHELLYDQLRYDLANGTAPTSGAITPGTPIAAIAAPAIQLNAVIVEGTGSEDLRSGPGHRRDTPLPGQQGTSVIYGRAVMYGGPFLRIRSLKQGDLITVTTGEGTFTYAVDDVRREGDPLPDALAAGGSRLTLVSAEGVSWRQGWAPDRQLSVDATLQGKATADQGGRPTVLPAQEKAMARSTGSWPSVVLWLQALAVGAFGASWATARWGGPQAWIVFVPVILAGLWGATDAAAQLLPNLM